MVKKKKNLVQAEITVSDIEKLRAKAEKEQLDKSDYIIINLCNLSLDLLELLENKDITIAKLKKLIFGSKSERREIRQQKPYIAYMS